MNWLLTAILCIVLVEVAVRLPFVPPLARIRRLGLRSVRVVGAKAISDHWKERAMGAYALGTLSATLKLALLLALVLGLAVIVVLAFEQGSRGFEAFILGWQGLLFSAVFASLYFVVRSKLVRGRL